jgi:dTMP kinase
MGSMKGLFISLDGVDGSGKSTQIGLLCQWLRERGRQVVPVRDPGGTPLGEALREVLLHRQEIPLGMAAEMLLYMASRAQLVEQIIRPALERGETVVADRFLLSNVVYQGSAGGMDVDDIWRVGQVATGGLEPDITLVLDIAPEAAASRIDRVLDRLESRGLEYMHSVRNGFLRETQRLQQAGHVIDANRPVDEVHADIVRLLQPSLR